MTACFVQQVPITNSLLAVPALPVTQPANVASSARVIDQLANVDADGSNQTAAARMIDNAARIADSLSGAVSDRDGTSVQPTRFS